MLTLVRAADSLACVAAVPARLSGYMSTVQVTITLTSTLHQDMPPTSGIATPLVYYSALVY